jgi:hypothetical protein
MLREVFFLVYRVFYHVRKSLQKLTGKEPQKPSDPREVRIQRRLARSKQRTQRAKKR